MNKKEMLMLHAVDAVITERHRQNKKWGWQRHPMGEWLKILIEEVGEAAQAMQIDSVQAKETDADNLYKELIQVAAVALAMAEQAKEEMGKKAPYMDLDD